LGELAECSEGNTREKLVEPLIVFAGDVGFSTGRIVLICDHPCHYGQGTISLNQFLAIWGTLICPAVRGHCRECALCSRRSFQVTVLDVQFPGHVQVFPG
jgi:hypothetical protein